MVVAQKKSVPANDQSSDYIPMRMMEIEIGQMLPTLAAFDQKRGQSYQRARCLVRLHTQPLGTIELQFADTELRADEYAAQIWQALHEQINAHLKLDGLPQETELTAAGLASPATPVCIKEREKFLANAPFVSVIVPTHDRPASLMACLDSLLASHYPHYEVIVVDNAPETDATVKLIEKLSPHAPHLHYVREDRQGPSWARNRGITAAKGEILAFTDDDVAVDAWWLASMAQGFEAAENVVCVTGLVLPLELETEAQYVFEEVGGYSKGFTPRVFDFKQNPEHLCLHPYIAERFGTGASMALRADFVRSVGGFDPALGRVGPVRCSQDIALFFQAVAHGHKIVYAPSSLVYHCHRRDYSHLTKQTYNHSVGYTAYLTKSLLEHPRLVFDFIAKLPYAFVVTLRSHFAHDQKELPHYAQGLQRELVLLRRKGLLYGPFGYIRSRQEVRKFNR